MKALLILVLCCACVQAQTVRVSARARARVPAPGATAAYTLDDDCADASLEGDFVVVAGIRPCTTQLIIVTPQTAKDSLVIVSQSQQEVNRIRSAHLMSRGIREAGNISSYYSSDRDELETSVDLRRSEGDYTTGVSITLANGYAYSPGSRRTALPRAAIDLQGPSHTITLLDAYVPEAGLTLQEPTIRGLHLEAKNWFFHAGVASLTQFRDALIENNPDHLFLAGYRASISERSTLGTSIQWLGASNRYVSGRSGAVGTVFYEYRESSRLHFQVETGFSSGVGLASLLEYSGDTEHLDLRFRSTPSRFPGLAVSPARGSQAAGTWTRLLTQNLSFDVTGSKNVFSRFDGSHDSNSSLSGQLHRHFGKFRFSGGIATAGFFHDQTASVRSLSVPLGISFEQRSFGNSFQYQPARDLSTDRWSHLVSDSVRLSKGRFTFQINGGRQTQAPSLEYILTNATSLRDALLREGFVLTTPEEIQAFLATHADLIASGFIRDLGINLTPLRRYAGSSVQWSAPRNRLILRAETRIVNDQRLTSEVTSVDQRVSASAHLAGYDFSFGVSHLQAALLGNTIHSTTFNTGIHRQLGSVPEFMSRLQETGRINGLVYLDSNENGLYDSGERCLPGVQVTLDGRQYARTNRVGWYSFDVIPGGKHTVDVQYPGGEDYTFTSAPHMQTAVNSTVNFGIANRRMQLFGTIRNDAGRGIGGVTVRFTGAEAGTQISSAAGAFVVHPPTAGEVSVSLDLNSLPPSYALSSVSTQRIRVDAEHPGHVEFVVRALRSVSGTVACENAMVNPEDVRFFVDKEPLPTRLGANGDYVIRELAPGAHEVLVAYASRRYTRVVELGPDPTNVHDISFDVCSSDKPH